MAKSFGALWRCPLLFCSHNSLSPFSAHEEVSMRHLFGLAALSGLLAMPVSVAGAAQDAGPSEWQEMTFHDLRMPSKADTLQVLVWPDIIADANAYVTTQLGRSLKGENAFVTA